MPTRPPMTPSASASTTTQRHHETAAEANRLQHGDLRAALADGHAHRVGGDQQDREDDRHADCVEQAREVPNQVGEFCQERAFCFGLRLDVAVLEVGVDRAHERGPLRRVRDLDVERAGACIRACAVLDRFVQILEVEERHPEVQARRLGGIRRVDGPDVELQRPADTIGRTDALHLDLIARRLVCDENLGAPPDLTTRGVVVSTSVAAKTPRPHEKIVPAAMMNTSRAMTTHAPRRERGDSSSRRSETSSFLRSSMLLSTLTRSSRLLILDRSRAAPTPWPHAATCLDCAPRTAPE